MKKIGLGIAMAAALMLAMAPASDTLAQGSQKRLSQGFFEELAKIGQPPAPEKKAKAKKKKKKAAKKAAAKKDSKKK